MKLIRSARGKSPVDAYLAIDEIIELAKAKGVDAIHPGYGFLSENVEFAEACEEAGIVFIGPDHTMMDNLGDKVKSKIVANKVGVPTIPGITETDTVGRGGFAVRRRMRISCNAEGGSRRRRQRYEDRQRSKEEMPEQFRSAKSEAKKAFGIDDIFIEKYWNDRSISKCRSWETVTAISYICMNVTARSREDTRR